MTSYLETYTAKELEQAFEFLDVLRESGTVNMFGASLSVAQFMGDTSNRQKVSKAILKAWMNTFDGVSSAEERVAKAIEKTEQGFD